MNDCCIQMVATIEGIIIIVDQVSSSLHLDSVFLKNRNIYFLVLSVGRITIAIL